MSMRTICAQLFIFAAVLFAWPQAAQAHAGHAHAIHVPASTQAASLSTPADHTLEQQAEQSLTTAAERKADHADGSPCSDRGCCAQSSCTTCFSMVAPTPPLLLPPSLAVTVGLIANPLPPGIAGSSLQRPPRFFA